MVVTIFSKARSGTPPDSTFKAQEAQEVGGVRSSLWKAKGKPQGWLGRSEDGLQKSDGKLLSGPEVRQDQLRGQEVNNVGPGPNRSTAGARNPAAITPHRLGGVSKRSCCRTKREAVLGEFNSQEGTTDQRKNWQNPGGPGN